MFAHPARQQRLAEGVIDLVRASVQKIFALQINLCATGMRSQPLRVKQRRRSAGVVAQQHVEFAPKIRIAASVHKLSRQLLERRDQCFRNVAATELAPVSLLVRFARCDSRFLHC